MAITVTSNPAQLSWSDFRVVDTLPDGSGEEAQTATETPKFNNIKPVTNQGKFSLPDLTLTVGLKRSETMVTKSAHKTADLLKHEQGHFDITFLTVRALASELERLSATSQSSLAQQANLIIQKHQRFAPAQEDQYDKATQHSRDTSGQSDWNRAIQAALQNSNAVSLQTMPL